jgi:hypothetical protein
VPEAMAPSLKELLKKVIAMPKLIFTLDLERDG